MWNQTPQAQAILSTFAASPPPTRVVRGNHGGYDTVYCSTVGENADRRVADLRAIWKAECERLYAEGARTGDLAPWHRCQELTEQEAVRRAVDGAIVLEAAE